MQHRTHRAVGDEDGIFQALVKILNSHNWVVLFIEVWRELASALGIHKRGHGAHQIVFGQDLEARVAHLHEDGWIFVAEDIGHTLNGSGAWHLRQRLAHHFAYHKLAQIFALQRHGQDLIFVNGADGNIFLEDRDLRNVLVLHSFQGVENGLIRASDHQFTDFAALVFGVHHFAGGDFYGGFHVAALAHPFVVIDLAEITHSSVGQKGDNESFGAEILCELQRSRNAAAAGTSGEQSFHFHQTACDHEAFFVVDLDDVIADLQIHSGGEKVFADTFDHVGFGLYCFAALHEVVVQRAVRVDTDDLDVGLFLLQKFADAAYGSPGAHPANEMCDLAFAVFPNFRARSEVMCFRIHGIVVLVGVIGIGNFAREFLGYRIVAAWIIGLHGRRANNHFRA